MTCGRHRPERKWPSRGTRIAAASPDLKNPEGGVIGAANVAQSTHGMLVHIKASGSPAGAKAVHFHSMAHCAANTGSKSSHGPHGEGKGEHGLLNAADPGKGDPGNIHAGENGVGEMQVFKTGVFIDGGASIVIYAQQDDQVAQPTGGADARILCGVLAATRDLSKIFARPFSGCAALTHRGYSGTWNTRTL